MANFERRSVPQKPKTMNCPITDKTFKKRDGSTGTVGYFSFRDGNKSYSIQIVRTSTGKTTKKGREITGWAQVAQFIDGGGNGSW